VADRPLLLVTGTAALGMFGGTGQVPSNQRQHKCNQGDDSS